MAGDGVSLPTTIAQMGTVAKTQARGAQQGQTAVPLPGEREKDDQLRVQRVQETKEQENRAIDPEGGTPDKRRRRRLKRNRKRLENEETGATTDGAEDDMEETAPLGRLIDLRV